MTQRDLPLAVPRLLRLPFRAHRIEVGRERKGSLPFIKFSRTLLDFSPITISKSHTYFSRNLILDTSPSTLGAPQTPILQPKCELRVQASNLSPWRVLISPASGLSLPTILTPVAFSRDHQFSRVPTFLHRRLTDNLHHSRVGRAIVASLRTPVFLNSHFFTDLLGRPSWRCARIVYRKNGQFSYPTLLPPAQCCYPSVSTLLTAMSPLVV